MAFQIDHIVDALRDQTLLLIGELGPFRCAMVPELLNKVSDEFEGVGGCKQIADVVNPFRVILCGLITNFEFVLQRAIRKDDTLLIKFGINHLFTLHNGIKRG